jgi:hypothetical protein
MNMKKKSKKVKKYAVGGDLRMSEEDYANNSGNIGSPSPLTPIPGGGGGFGGNDGSATGQVKTISKAAGRAGDYLSTAGRAIGSGDGEGAVFDYPEAMKKGGKVKKKKKKSPTIKARGVGRAVQKKIRPAKMVKM